MIKIYVINLAKRKDRLKKIEDAFAKFSFDNYKIIEAVDGNNLTPEDLQKSYNEKTANRIFRKLTIGEIGCALSHQKIYDLVLENNLSGALIIEDDFVISENFINYIKQPEIITDVDCLILSCHSSNKYKYPQKYNYQIMNATPNGRFYFTKETISYNGFVYRKFDEQSYKNDFIHGTMCYYISNKGCQKFKINYPVIVPADWVWNVAQNLSIYGLDPLFILNSNLIDLETRDSDIHKDRKKNINQVSKKVIKRIYHPLHGR